MAVAVKHTPEVSSASLLDRIAVASLAGVVYVLGCLGIVFKLIPSLWWAGWSAANLGAYPIVGQVLLGLTMLAAAVGLIVLGARLLGPRAVPGVRAGIFLGLLMILVVLLLARWASMWIEHWVFFDGWFGTSGPRTGAIITAAVGVLLLLLALRLFFRTGTELFMLRLEGQGWFSAVPYKPLQGLRVRRATVFGLLLLVGAGIYTMISHGTLRKGASDWSLNIPFTGKAEIHSAGNLAPELEKDYPDKDFIDPEVQVKIDNPGDARDFRANEIVDRRTFDRVVERLTREKATPPTEATPNLLVLDRYQLRSLNSALSDKVKIYLENESDRFHAGQIVTRAEYDQEVERLRERGVGKEGLPALDPAGPLPATGPTTFASLTLLPSLQFTLPLLLLAAALWLAWRVVNYPTFADFLIATEAEMNKVSWTTQRRLIQDTIVVLATVFLMAIYLFAMDQAWRVVLSWKPIGVLQIPEDQSRDTSVEQKRW